MRHATGNTATDVHNQGDPNTGEGPDGDLFTDADDKWGTGAQSDRARRPTPPRPAREADED